MYIGPKKFLYTSNTKLNMVATKLLTTPKKGSPRVFIQSFKIINILLMENPQYFSLLQTYFCKP
jgi:hypothetical protein